MTATRPALRHRPLWLAAGYALLGIIIYLSLSSDPVHLDTGLPYQDKLLHALAYFALMFWFVQIYHAWRDINAHAVTFVLVGVSMELLQGLGRARVFEIEDMFANALGVVLAMLLARTPLRNLLSRLESLL